ncbi:MAG: hypothetical protein GXP63_02685 [DPANN group archaeon]|nr:hypothetical protein [DPANN group archaeon]
MNRHFMKVLENKTADPYCVLRVERPPAFDFLAGQFVMIRRKEDPLCDRRAFSIASSPLETGHLEFFIKKVDAGAVSPRLYTAQQGDVLELSGPFGKFVLSDVSAGDEKGVCLIGAGSGLAPLLSMLRTLVLQKYPGRIHLIHSTRKARDLLYRQELERYAATLPLVSYTQYVSREVVSGCLQGRIDLQQIEIKHPDAVLAYVCGPPALVDDIVAALKKRGLSEDAIKTERYD